MFFFYSLIYTLGFILLSPRFLFDLVTGGKYASGFAQRLGWLPEFKLDTRPVLWLHCVSVGEANAARPLVESIKTNFPKNRLVISTTTKTGQKLAKEIFADSADAVFFFPFDWRFSVKKALRHYRPSVVMLMETEIWPNFIRETNHAKSRICIVNGRLSERSYTRYARFKTSMRRILGYLDLALMQTNADAKRLMELGIRASKVRVSGNLKFDHNVESTENELTEAFRSRFSISPDAPLIIAASTHQPEEKWILDAFKEVWKNAGERLPRLMIAPRHPERFAEVRALIKNSGFDWACRTEAESSRDKTAEIILLDSIGELRSAYPLAEIVLVGGSLIPHGGQSIFEPAASGRAIITGHNTANFADAVTEFLDKDALLQLNETNDSTVVAKLADAFRELLQFDEKRKTLGTNALAVMNNNRGAAERTIEYLTPLIAPISHT
ncbi:MAG: 3-deoxy-D-manno-octulosonic acid transferase [Pyrinomonadaceae bacterium]|nr:3-deoxy-D-manno-octulosonic acid transferase [Pyrinomonadaceae bacterium]